MSGSGPAKKMTANEMTMTITGFEELEIVKAFGEPFDEMNWRSLARALVFVKSRRDGLAPDPAFDAAMGLSLEALGDQFADGDEEDEDPDLASTPEAAEAGKDA